MVATLRATGRMAGYFLPGGARDGITKSRVRWYYLKRPGAEEASHATSRGDLLLQSAVGNYFRNKLQTLGAAEFIEKRDEVQHSAEEYIQKYLSRYEVETRGVYIQDVVFPQDLVDVLTSREIAAQERATFAQQREAQEARVSLEQQRGVADMQAELAQAKVSIDIEQANAQAARARAEGEAAVITTTGGAEATRTRALGEASAAAEAALGLARAKGFEAQRKAIGAQQTALVAALREVASGDVKIVPDIQVGGESGVMGGLAALLMRNLANGSHPELPPSNGDSELSDDQDPLERPEPDAIDPEIVADAPSGPSTEQARVTKTRRPLRAKRLVEENEE